MAFDDITFGSTVNIISKSSIRYEGVFENFDESTLLLSNVRSFGTEERVVERKFESSSRVYKFIRFKGDDIAEIYLAEKEFVDPAIMSAEILDDSEDEEQTRKENSVESITSELCRDKNKFSKTEDGKKYFKPFNLVNFTENQPSSKSQFEVSNDALNDQKSPLQIFVTSNKKTSKIASDKNRYNVGIGSSRLEENEDTFEASSDNCAQYVYSKPKTFNAPKKKMDILTMKVKEFNFEDGENGDNQKTSYKVSPNKRFTQKPKIDNDNYTFGSSTISKPSYDASNSFFDELPYTDEDEKRVRSFSKQNRNQQRKNTHQSNIRQSDNRYRLYQYHKMMTAPTKANSKQSP